MVSATIKRGFASALFLLAVSSCAIADDNRSSIANERVAADRNQSQEFRDKYRLESMGKRAMEGYVVPDINHSDYEAVRDINLTAFESAQKQSGFDIRKIASDMNKTNPAAEEVFKSYNSKATEKKIDEQVRFILKDEAFGAYEYAGKYREMIDEQLRDPNSPVFSSVRQNSNNKYLNKNEQVIVVISSSIPRSTLKSYFEDIDAIGAPFDVKFVLRGMVGDDLSSLKPTVEYIGNLARKNEKEKPKSAGDLYTVNIDINPKITRKYGIELAPAVVYIKNYNPAIEQPKSLEEAALSDGEEYYIAYGAARLDYSLTKINEKVKSDGVKRLIDALQKRGFFNQSKGEKQ